MLMDLMFGTYYDPRGMPARVGIEEPFPCNYVAALVEPMVPRWSFRWRSGT
jgi:hypothetical protein